MDDLGVPLFPETPIWIYWGYNPHISQTYHPPRLKILTNDGAAVPGIDSVANVPTFGYVQCGPLLVINGVNTTRTWRLGMTSLGRHEGPQKIMLNFTQNICSTCGFSTFHSQNKIGTPLHILNPSNYSCPRHFHTSTKARFGTTTQSVASSSWPNSGWTRHKSIGYFLVFQVDDWLVQIFTNIICR